MLDITILNDTLFPIFLFILYFSLGCIAIHTQKNEKELDCKVTEDIISYSQILSPIFDEILEDLEETGTQEPEPMSKNPIPIPTEPENPDLQILLQYFYKVQLTLLLHEILLPIEDLPYCNNNL
jgi:hypothetical protein